MKKFFFQASLLKGKLLFIIGLTLLLALLSCVPYLHAFLALNYRINGSELLVVEGWLPDYALEEVVKEYNHYPYKYIVTTGGPLPEYFRMPVSGNLIFNINENFSNSPDSNNYIIIKVYGSEVDNKFAHFNVWINGMLIGDTYAKAAINDFKFQISPSIKNIKSVRLHFDNDALKNGKDRDLFVKSIIIGEKEIDAYSENVYYDKGKLDGKGIIEAKDKTFAESGAAKLIALGLPADKVIAVPSPEVEIHRTFTSAFAFKKWLHNFPDDINAVCIFSLGTHARRSWITYKKVLSGKVKTGVVAVENNQYDPEEWWQSKAGVKAVVNELFSYLYIKFLFYPQT